MSKNGYHHGDLRNALIEQARRVLETEGAAAVSLRGLARALGVSHAAPAHHFPDRDALLRAVATEGYRALRDTLVASRTVPPDRRMAAVASAYVEFAMGHPALFRLMFDPTIDHPVDDDCWALAEESFAVLAAAATSRADAPARASRTEIDAQVLRLWSTLHGAATLYIDGALEMMFPGPRGKAKFLRRFRESLAL